MHFDIPEYTEPYTYESPDSSWEIGEDAEHTIETEEVGDIIVHVTELNGKPYVKGVSVPVSSDEHGTDAKAFWTVVHWAREHGVPGVQKERLSIHFIGCRLGALYCIGVENGVFEFTDRETDYNEWGENPVESMEELQ